MNRALHVDPYHAASILLKSKALQFVGKRDDAHSCFLALIITPDTDAETWQPDPELEPDLVKVSTAHRQQKVGEQWAVLVKLSRVEVLRRAIRQLGRGSDLVYRTGPSEITFSQDPNDIIVVAESVEPHTRALSIGNQGDRPARNALVTKERIVKDPTGCIACGAETMERALLCKVCIYEMEEGCMIRPNVVDRVKMQWLLNQPFVIVWGPSRGQWRNGYVDPESGQIQNGPDPIMRSEMFEGIKSARRLDTASGEWKELSAEELAEGETDETFGGSGLDVLTNFFHPALEGRMSDLTLVWRMSPKDILRSSGYETYD